MGETQNPPENQNKKKKIDWEKTLENIYKGINEVFDEFLAPTKADKTVLEVEDIFDLDPSGKPVSGCVHNFKVIDPEKGILKCTKCGLTVKAEDLGKNLGKRVRKDIDLFDLLI